MTLQLVLDAFGRAPSALTLRSRLPSRGVVLRLGGLPGSSGAVLAAWLAATEAQRLLVVIAPAPGDAERWLVQRRVLDQHDLFARVGAADPEHGRQQL